jgi:hypothetical protein
MSTDRTTASWPWVRLEYRLERREPVRQADALLLGLSEATRLRAVVLEGLSKQAESYARQLTAGLPEVLRLLIGLTEAAVGDSVLTYRA